VAFLHGVGGATGFTFVLVTVVREPNFEPIRQVLYLLIATVLLGAVNLLFHIRKVRHRTSLILMHGMTAVSSAAMLIRAILVHVPEAPASVPDSAPPMQSAGPKIAMPSPTGSAAPPPSAEPLAETAVNSAEKAASPARGEFVVDEVVRRVLETPLGFDTKSSNVSEGSRSALNEIAETLKRHPEIELVEVQGHADERGDEAHNVALTLGRARAVVQALVQAGVSPRRLRSAGYGSRCPADPACQTVDASDSCHTPDQWQRDRRVAFVVLRLNNAAFHGAVVCARGASLIPAADRSFHRPTR
jgi:outer membrane protein OmpA-like peptidoglycan-associated protein